MKKQFLCILTYFIPISESNLQGSIRLKDILLGMEGGRDLFYRKKIYLNLNLYFPLIFYKNI